MARWLTTLSKVILSIGAPLLVIVALRRAGPRAAIIAGAAGARLASGRGSPSATQADAAESDAPHPEHAEHPPAAAPPHYPTRLSSFTKGLLWLGLLLILFVIGDLIARGFQREIAIPVWELSRDDSNLGRQAIIQHGCGGCHVIPGIRHATGRVGPQLNGFRDQIYIAGMLPNIPENLTLWIQNPQAVNPKSAMPNLGVSEAEAREIAVYLYAQR